MSSRGAGVRQAVQAIGAPAEHLIGARMKSEEAARARTGKDNELQAHAEPPRPGRPPLTSGRRDRGNRSIVSEARLRCKREGTKPDSGSPSRTFLFRHDISFATASFFSNTAVEGLCNA
jgi:hypothetical protein